MTLLPAWAVQGGQATPEAARAMAFAATGGVYGAGVVEWSDFKVTANGTSSVQIAPGVAVIPTRYASSVSQSTYIVPNDSELEKEIPATGSGSGNVRYIIIRMEDPQYGGQTPSDPATAAYSRISATLSISNLPFPFLLLAVINVPPSTTNITQSMITDLREVSQPRSRRSLYTYDLTSPQADTLTTDPAGESWPDVGGFQVKVPPWATMANIKADFGQVEIPAGSTRQGFLTVMLGSSYPTAGAKFQAPGAPGVSRQSYIAAGDVVIPSSMRGEMLYVYTRGVINGGTGGGPTLDANSSITLDIEFLEVAR